MKKLKLKFLYIFSIMLFCGTFFICNNVLATDYEFFDGDFSVPPSNVYLGCNEGFPFLGQRFETDATSTNLSLIKFKTFSNDPVTNGMSITVCKGIPNNLSQSDIATNGMTCNWTGNSVVDSETLFTVDNTEEISNYYYYTLDTPVTLEAEEDYYVMFEMQCADTAKLIMNTNLTGRIVNDGQWPEGVAYLGFYKDNDYSAGVDYYVSNDSETAGIERLASADSTVYSVRIHSCKEEDNDDGQFGMAVWDNDADVYLATSTLYDMSELEYESDITNCLMAHTYEFPLGFKIENTQRYQYQIYRTDNGVGFPTADTATYYYAISEESAQFVGEMDDTEETAKLFEIKTVPYYDVDIVDIDWVDPDINISNETFTFPSVVNCLVATSCPITVYYSVDDIDKDLYMFEKDEEDFLEYIDAVIPLIDKPFLKIELTPTERATETVDYYQYFLYGGIASSSLHQYTRVNWVEELTEELENQTLLGSFFGQFKNIFPLSLYFQIKNVIKDITTNEAEQTYISIELTDFVASEYDDLIASTSMILDQDMISDNLDIWDTHIYPFMEMIIYLINFIFIIFLILPGKQSVGGEGV